ncbi:pirin family protein [Streptomonospora salina]|uniref:Redox-sensitive bicupin YhaK (Pirin superfamily) n=1 Tax=Streptomonospora salina TaxID=104205 RepID=A0A841E5H1_9ACTN|nr:pirin family protein [Streptomonospora salina]MBB5998395.1 redox-sensitive bicupin YhaK (pirin superfamily) [Streptomonospora salina]
MSNVEAAPQEVVCAEGPAAVELVEPRDVPLGGPRAMTVRRTLPRRKRSLIGAWCFVDHYGPDRVSATGGMQVPGHPHTGLQTVSWLFEGEIEHRDTTGAHAAVRPGELNLMTAGSGIAHSEFSTPGTDVLHGAQLWLALPRAHRQAAPAFEHYAPPQTGTRGAQLRVFLGSLGSETSPVATFSPLLGAEIVLDPGARLRLPVEESFEHGVLVDTGSVDVGGVTAGAGRLAYLPPGRSSVEAHADTSAGARLLLLGGEPLNERIVMWWNFIGSDHDEIAAYRRQWQDERSDPSRRDRRFGDFPEAWTATLPAPELPNARLIPRE